MRLFQKKIIIILSTLTREGCSIIEGTAESLERLGMDYVDVIFAHRCDITVPIVRHVIKWDIHMHPSVFG